MSVCHLHVFRVDTPVTLIHTHMRICVCIHHIVYLVNTFMSRSLYTHTKTYTYACTEAHTPKCVHVQLVYTNVFTQTHRYILLCISMCVLYVYCVCVCVFMHRKCTRRTRACSNVHTHTHACT
jgi:hypothetical protein